MPESRRFAVSSHTLLITMSFTILMVLFNGFMAMAQAIDTPVDLQFKVLNGTTGEAGTLDRLQIQYRTTTLVPVLDTTPQGSAFTLHNVPIKDRGQYIITAWSQGVPYFGQHRGSTLMEKETSLHIFDTTASLDGISISGLTILVKKEGALLQLEYMLKIHNAATPQITILGNPTFEFKLPTGYSQLKAEYKRGPDPIAIATNTIGEGIIGLPVPLTSGNTVISLTAAVPFTEGMDLPIASNLPVDSWSVMTSPNNLAVDSFELEYEPEADHGMAGWNRYLGSPLESDRNLVIRLSTGPKGGPQENLFSSKENGQPKQQPDSPSGTESKDKDNFPWIPIGLVTILAIAMAVKRRRS